MIRILVVHEIRLMSSMISGSLSNESDIEIVGCATTLEEAKVQARECDILLVSSGLPNQGALAVTEAFRSHPSVKVVVLGLPESETAILRFVEAGAAGYVCRENSTEELLRTIRAVSCGQAHVSPDIAAAMIARMAELADSAKQRNGASALYEGRPNLTDRELEVLSLIGLGLSNQDIAGRLTIELGTVKNHVHNILRKLDVSSRDEAAACLPWIQAGAAEPAGGLAGLEQTRAQDHAASEPARNDSAWHAQANYAPPLRRRSTDTWVRVPA